MDEGLSPVRTVLLALGAVTIALLALNAQWLGLVLAVPAFLAAGWVCRWEELPPGLADRIEGLVHVRG